MGVVGDAVRETTGALGLVFRNPGLRKVNLALAGSLIGDWAYATAVTVWAFGVGGVTAVGVWGVVRLLLLATVTPFASVLADRYPRRLVMISSDVVRAVLVLAAAGCVYWSAPVLTVFALATLASIAGSPFRPSQQALLPSLVDRPEELTAANGTGSTLESLAFFLGPAIGGLLLTVADVPVVFMLQALTFLWSAAMIWSIRVPSPAGATAGTDDDRSDEVAAGAPDAAPDGSAAGHDAEPAVGFWRESVAGFRTIWAHADLRLVSGIYCAQTVVAGASMVFAVAIAVDVTGFGAEGVGYLDSVLGVGALLGGLVAIGRAGRFRLATDFGVGVLLWALPLLLIAVWPQTAPAFLAMFLIGGANPVVDVNASTILQRLSPDAVLGRVFGALETGLISTMALGALVTPLLISWIGLRGALAVLAVAVTLAVLPAFGRLRRLDTTLTPPAGLELLRGSRLFAPLDGATLESLASRLEELRVPAGRVVVAEGEAGDRFYLIESGTVSVSRDGVELRQEGPGDFFGEIALLRDVPRTATVTTTEDTVLRVLDRETFLAALDGSSEVRTRAEEVVALRLPV